MIIQGSIIGVLKGDTRSLDYSSYEESRTAILVVIEVSTLLAGL